MPRYYFHVTAGADDPDLDGTFLVDVGAARTQAIETAGELLKEHGQTFWGSGEWRMTVVNEAGDTVCLLRFSAE